MRGRYIILIFLSALFVSNLSIAQKQRARNIKRGTIIYYSDINDSTCFGPYYEQGVDSLLRFIHINGSSCPIRSGEREAKAVVYVKFDIDSNGNTSNTKILRVDRVYYDEYDKSIEEYITRDVWSKEIDYDYCRNEAFRLIRLLKFKPARRGNANVYFSGYVLPLHVIYPASSHD
ncbi:hypothetical protein [uncultured Acetobacteroides sp.]|uniref:energy transducer TonB n=1 Tax=uncultured Acetobacteroides sp. TaxID=1760811 RepID=UPI0029F5953B|nr:hypothetical protein [uncultured Acetobacteroides sp.]